MNVLKFGRKHGVYISPAGSAAEMPSMSGWRWGPDCDPLTQLDTISVCVAEMAPHEDSSANEVTAVQPFSWYN